MRIVSEVAKLREQIALSRIEGAKIGLVPTMGSLHDGHLSLIREARLIADRVVVTIFVNPAQFNSADDLDQYPRDLQRDLKILEHEEVDIAFCPEIDQVYPAGFRTSIAVSGAATGLCGSFRPGHFAGVATIVTKLLLWTNAFYVFLGEKDFQQVHVVRQVVKDLGIETRVISCPTIREADGLALSSRNARLDASARQAAPGLITSLRGAAKSIVQGQSVAKAIEEAHNGILASGYERVEYIELRSESDLLPLDEASVPSRILAAAWLGSTRLIDNIAIGSSTARLG